MSSGRVPECVCHPVKVITSTQEGAAAGRNPNLRAPTTGRFAQSTFILQFVRFPRLLQTDTCDELQTLNVSSRLDFLKSHEQPSRTFSPKFWSHLALLVLCSKQRYAFWGKIENVLDFNHNLGEFKNRAQSDQRTEQIFQMVVKRAKKTKYSQSYP